MTGLTQGEASARHRPGRGEVSSTRTWSSHQPQGGRRSAGLQAEQKPSRSGWREGPISKAKRFALGQGENSPRTGLRLISGRSSKKCMAVLRTLGQLNRVRIMRLLIKEELGVNEIAERLGMPGYNVSKLPRILKETSLLQMEKPGLNLMRTTRILSLLALIFLAGAQGQEPTATAAIDRPQGTPVEALAASKPATPNPEERFKATLTKASLTGRWVPLRDGALGEERSGDSYSMTRPVVGVGPADAAAACSTA